MKLALAANLLLLALESVGAALSWKQHGISMLQFYTEDSNLLMLVACLVSLFALLWALKRGERVPLWALVLKYVAVCCLGLTFLVVLFVLIPMNIAGGFWPMLFSGSMLYHHTLCPILGILAFLLLERDGRLAKKHLLWALLPTLLYAAVTISLNIAKVMEGPYPFLMVHQQSWWVSVLWCALILGIAAGIGWALNRNGVKKARS